MKDTICIVGREDFEKLSKDAVQAKAPLLATIDKEEKDVTKPKTKLIKPHGNADLSEAMQWLSRLAAPGGHPTVYPRIVAAEIARLRKDLALALECCASLSEDVESLREAYWQLSMGRKR